MKLLNKEIDKRIVIKLNRSIRGNKETGIMTYGSLNDYPQIIEKLIYGSQTAKACVNIYSKFIGGSGFANPDIGKVIVGIDKKGKPVTLDKIRRDAAQSLAMFNGVYIHCNENLDKQVGTTKVVPFKNCRFSREDSNGYCGKIAIHPNWSKEIELNEGKSFQNKDISWYYNFKIESIPDNIIDSKSFENFKGQIYSLFFDDNYLYPLSPFDSVYLDMDTEYQIQLFKNREIRNGFNDKIILNIAPPIDDKEKEETIAKCKSWIGPDGDKLLLFQSEFNEDGTLKGGQRVDQIKTNINGNLFDLWEKSLANNIRKAIHALPAVLIDYEQGKLSQASGEMLIQAVGFYNGLTQGLRESFSEMFKDIYSYSNDQILSANTNWDIKPFSLMPETIPIIK